ncbi:MAG: LysR family transcriptional regulator [Paludibacterium sp.]|uniref:LysR family transcriptional regulator n=1 Tax=Paludibacterium sp. TaxID=1917523 RepID=UPI0025FFA402|nr:LysR family transcriptional regulator [Paludibacterium sp.]MBV8047636.1 LysR family transcriptional regulator [Paludibacterium sp.]
MDYFAAMRIFVQVAELGSFTKAAEKEGVKISTVSRCIGALESDLGASLFNRSTRALHLTEAGQHFFDRCINILDELELARHSATSFAQNPKGVLRLMMPVDFGRLHIVPHLPDFMTEYPDIELDIAMVDETLDMIGGGYDLAVQAGALADSSLFSRRLAPLRQVLVASPAYLNAMDSPQVPQDLAHMESVLFALKAKNYWHFSQNTLEGTQQFTVQASGKIRANHSEAIREACLAGLGLAVLPTWLVGSAIVAGHLVRVLDAWDVEIAPGPDRAIWGVYPPKKVIPPKVRAFLAFFEQRFGSPPYWDRGLPR